MQFFPNYLITMTAHIAGDIEIKKYVVLQKPHAQDNRLPPPHTLIMDFTMTHVGSDTHVYTLLVNSRTQGGQTVLLIQTVR